MVTRRTFLKGAGSAALVLGLGKLSVNCSDASVPVVPATEAGKKTEILLVEYGNWQDVYRKKWTWDAVVKGVHGVVNCASACPFNLFIKDGVVLREEQNTIMDAANPSLPDFNPRGCQKGACFSELMYAPQRLRYPLQRIGERGSGKWKRISWEQALAEVAGKIVEVSVKHGPEAVIYECGTANAGYGSATGGERRFFELQGATMLDGWAAVGDMPLGAILTMGIFNVDSSADDYLNSDLIYLWLGNPSYTRIPDAHFMWEARYNGTKVVSVAPDYNASTMHVDDWMNVRVGTDAALGLGMAGVIINEGLFKPGFVKEQTDLPLLIRMDNGMFLRESDLEKRGVDNIFYVWDRNKGKAVPSPGSEGLGRRGRLDMSELDAALEGRFEVELTGGRKVEVTTVFQLLKQRLQDYTPEKVARITGVSVIQIEAHAREFAAAKAVSIFGSWGMMKHHHSDLFQRAMILLLALTGNVGRRGTGLRIGAWYMLSSIESIISGVSPTWYQKALMKMFKPTVREMIGYFRDYEKDKMDVPALMFLYEHGGLKDVVGRQEYHDANPGKAIREAMKESIEKDWVPLWPRPGKDPRMMIHTRVNPLRRWPQPQVIEKTLWPKLELIVGVNIKMTATTLKSDIVLPAAGYYERRGIKYAQSYVPYYIVGDQAVDPVGESRSEWEIFGVLAQMIEQRCRENSVEPVKDVYGNERDLRKIYQDWTQNGEFDPYDDLHFYERAAKESPEMGHISWQEAVSKGAVPIKSLGPFRTHTNFCSDYEPGETVYSSQWFTQYKQPWPTLTGRMQFYIDHEWYRAAGEHLPMHKEPPPAGGHYPLRMTGGHTRWSIHSIWRDQSQMLQLQRGEPAAYVSREDARARGVRDNDRIRVFNDAGACEVLAKISPSVQPGQLIIYHAWENFQFKDWRSNQEPVVSPWKALHMVEYGQLHYRFLFGGPHHNPRATPVDFASV